MHHFSRALEVLGDWPQVLSVLDSELLPEEGAASQDQEMEAGPEDSRLFGNAAHLLRYLSQRRECTHAFDAHHDSKSSIYLQKH